MKTLENELEALEKLKASLADVIADDPDFVVDLAEAETSVMDFLDAMLTGELMDRASLEGLEAAMQTLDSRRARFKKRIETRRAMIEQALLVLERDKLERPTATVSLTKRPRKLIILDEAAIPAKFWNEKTEIVLDKKAVENALKADEFVEGAQLDNGGQTLTVRRK